MRKTIYISVSEEDFIFATDRKPNSEGEFDHFCDKVQEGLKEDELSSVIEAVGQYILNQTGKGGFNSQYWEEGNNLTPLLTEPEKRLIQSIALSECRDVPDIIEEVEAVPMSKIDDTGLDPRSLSAILLSLRNKGLITIDDWIDPNVEFTPLGFKAFKEMTGEM